MADCEAEDTYNFYPLIDLETTLCHDNVLFFCGDSYALVEVQPHNYLQCGL